MTGTANALALAAAIVWAGFVLVYGLGAPWWKTSTGRNYWSLALLIAGVLVLVALARFGAEVPWRSEAAVVIYGGLLVLGLRHLYDFVAGQLRGREHRLQRIAREARAAARVEHGEG